MHKHRNNNYCHLKPITDINIDSKDKIIVTGLMYTCPSPVSPMEEIKHQNPFYYTPLPQLFQNEPYESCIIFM